MEEIEPKSDLLWFFIARSIYLGFVSYFIVIAIAFLRDLFRKPFFHSKQPLGHHTTFSPIHWKRSFFIHYRETRVFYYVEFVRLTCNLVVCTIYIIGTYKQDVLPYMRVINRSFCVFFIFDIICHVIVADSALTTILSLSVFFDAFSYPSLIKASGPNSYLNFSFLRAFAAFSAYSRLERRMFIQIFSSKRLIGRLTFQCLALFYLLAAGIQLLEIPGDLLSVQFRQRWFNFDDWNFLNSCYFVIVTLSTVGYGDMSPATLQGKVYTLFMIIVGIVIFTSVIAELVEKAQRSRGSGTFLKNSHTRHVILTGTPNMTDLVHFVSEFYSDPRLSNVKAKMVVLIEDPPWSEIEWFQRIARNQFLQDRLTFLIGNVRNSTDLQRAKIRSADAVFILTSPSTGVEPSLQDTGTIMRALAIRNVRTDIPIYAQTLLEDSNLQAQVALSTPSAFSKGETHFRDTNMTSETTYGGLFLKVLEAEFDVLPRVHQKAGMPCFEDILRHHKTRERNINIHKVDSLYSEDLYRSQHVCLQEIHMALISGNLRANGVGTLLSNMYLDVQTTKHVPEDPPWLSEFHMGAACSLAYAIIPIEIDGVKVRDIAADLFHVGIIIIATSDSEHVQPRPILRTDTMLREGDLAVLLTYHEYKYLGAALHLVSLRYAAGEMRHPPPEQSKDRLGNDHGPNKDKIPGVDDDTYLHPTSSSLDIASHGDPLFPTVVPSPGSMPAHHPSGFLASLSGDDLDALADLAAVENQTERRGLLESATSDALLEERADGYMPDHLSGHIIIAMEGEAPLRNLPLLLKNLWRKDKRRSMRYARRARIVVVHPCLSSEFRARFARFEKVSLFFVEGSPASRATWRKARLSTAKAVATVADYTKPWELSDARSIFTLLTLDVSTSNEQDLFICSELVDEKSLEFLREPIHPRRRGASLGEPIERMLSTPISQQVQFSAEASDSILSDVDMTDNGIVSHPRFGERLSSASETFSSLLKGSHRHNSGEKQEGEKEKEQESVAVRTDKKAENKDNESSKNTGERKKKASENGDTKGSAKTFRILKPQKGSRGAGKKSHGSSKGSSTEVMSFVLTAMTAHNPDENESSVEAGGDPNDRAGAARARRGTLFARSRYASGELLVQSSAITLLAREYIEPGFLRFFTSILGTEPSSPGMKIRLVRIPDAMFDMSRGYSCRHGRRLIRYNDIFNILVRVGVTPLGIYRSGTAPALIPSKLRRKRGHAIFEELIPFLQKMEGVSNEPKSTQKKGWFERSMRLVIDTLPSQLREVQGQVEVQGMMGGSSTSVDLTDDENDYAQEQEQRASQALPVQSPDNVVHSSTLLSEEQDNASREKESTIRQSTYRRGWMTPRKRAELARFFIDDDDSLEVPGQVKYKECDDAKNILPYVYTLPDPNTWCAETDAIYIMCDASFDLPNKWSETGEEVSDPKKEKELPCESEEDCVSPVQ